MSKGRILISLLVLGFVNTSFARVIDPDRGTVHMNGQIQEAACAIHVNDDWQEIQFGIIPFRSFEKRDQGPEKSFSIRLINCDLEKVYGGLWPVANITFEGETSAKSEKIFAVHGEAKGFGLHIIDGQGNIAQSGVAFTSTALSKGNNELHYRLQTVRDGNALKEGGWRSLIRFIIAYQ